MLLNRVINTEKFKHDIQEYTVKEQINFKKLSEISGVNASSISRIMTGFGTMNLKNAAKLCEVMDTDVEQYCMIEHSETNYENLSIEELDGLIDRLTLIRNDKIRRRLVDIKLEQDSLLTILNKEKKE